MSTFAAIILAGGSARRLGGRDKPHELVGGVSLLNRVLAACGGASERIVVGPEHRGGPVAATAAGLERLSVTAAGLERLPAGGLVALLAADQPFLTARALQTLAEALPGHDVAVYVDSEGRRQYLCGMWRLSALRVRLAALTPENASLLALFDGLRVAECHSAQEPPPWYDCDTPEQLHAAREHL